MAPYAGGFDCPKRRESFTTHRTRKESFINSLKRQVPLGRLATAEEDAKFALFLHQRTVIFSLDRLFHFGGDTEEKTLALNEKLWARSCWFNPQRLKIPGEIKRYCLQNISIVVKAFQFFELPYLH